MKTLCITGAAPADLLYIEGILTQAGMGPARSSQRDQSMTIGFWHEQVETRLKELSAQTEKVELGRVWEQLASDIFVANMDQPTWGWSDTRSLPLLDFWQLFDPQMRFVLVTCSAQRYVAQVIADGEPVDSVKTLLTDWAQHHIQMLQFFHRFPNRAVLVDIDHCMDQPAGFVEACQQAWQLPLKKAHFANQVSQTYSVLEQFLASELIKTDDQWQALQNELWLSTTPVGSLLKPPVSLDIPDLVRAYQDERVRQTLEVSALSEELSKLEPLKVKIQEVTKQSQTSEAQVAKLKKEVEAAEKQTTEINTLNTQLKETQEEADLLLAQLHQVQEELETTFLSHQETKKQLQELEPLKAKVQEVTKQLQIAEKQAQAAEAQAAKLKKEAESATKQTAEVKTLNTQLKETQEEADLLLAQLHQVQEELENYFLKYQDAKNALELAEARWQRLLKRVPDYFDLDAIEITAHDETDAERVDWKLTSLDVAGRVVPEVRLTTTVIGGVACLEFPRRVGSEELLVRWPLAVSKKDSIMVALSGDAKLARERTDILLQLGASDWDLVQVTLNALISEIETPRSLQLPADYSTAVLLAGLKKLKAGLGQLPPLFRFDEIKLKGQQANPDYEYLWFDFKKVAIGTKRLASFDFRLSCVEGKKAGFGTHTKLEFPETTGRLAIDAWFSEIRDDFGAKFELRFAKPDAMDVNVWRRLPGPDQLFIAALLSQIPTYLNMLEVSGAKTKREMGDWQKIVREMLEVFAARTAGQAPKSVPQQKSKGAAASTAGVRS